MQILNETATILRVAPQFQISWLLPLYSWKYTHTKVSQLFSLTALFLHSNFLNGSTLQCHYKKKKTHLHLLSVAPEIMSCLWGGHRAPVEKLWLNVIPHSQSQTLTVITLSTHLTTYSHTFPTTYTICVFIQLFLG